MPARLPGVLPVLLAALVVSGCSGSAFRSWAADPRPAARADGSAFPGDFGRVFSALPAAPRRGRVSATSSQTAEPSGPDVEEDAPLLRVPPLERWPRTMWLDGAAYALVQFNPYVGQLGELTERERAEAGVGYGLLCGYRMVVRGTTAVGLEVGYESSEHESGTSHTTARASRTGVGIRANFRADERLQPFASAGAAQYALDFEDMPARYDLSGRGVFFGGGVDFSPSGLFSVRAELSLGLWEAADDVGGSGLAVTLTFGLGAAASF